MNVPPQLNLNSDIQLRLFPVAPLAQNPLLAVVFIFIYKFDGYTYLSQVV